MLSIQYQSDEFRIAQEYIFNIETSKFQDLLSSQALRFEQEILYIIQVKDKVYAEMMIAKDGKIMSLIEGSDLQTLIQRNEMVSCFNFCFYFKGYGKSSKRTSKRY